MKGIAIIAAAGKGTRAAQDKIWLKIGGKTVLERTAEAFFAANAVDEIVFVVAEDKLEEAKAAFQDKRKPCLFVSGGATRTESVRNALRLLEEESEETVVGIHDGARPFVTPELIDRCFLKAAEKGSAIPVVPCVDSMRKVGENENCAVDRADYVLVQTPQCFILKRIAEAYLAGGSETDDATLYERVFGSPVLVEGDEINKKITYSSDIFELIRGEDLRVGVGYDVHPLREGRALVLGGVTIPFEKGLLGHSDADALTHAIMDAILTAAGLPDIGHFFPPSDPAFEGAYSIDLLAVVKEKINGAGFSVVNVGATIMAERPKMAGYIPEMEKIIAKTLGISDKNVKIAATTTEKLGVVGEGKGIAAEATALLLKTKTV